ncbi:ATP-dependent sacrificial sulfur transferase LarE, partial [Frankia sp. CiP3]
GWVTTLGPVSASVAGRSVSSEVSTADGRLLAGHLDDLAARFAELGSVLVAFSGGADSAFLLAAAVRALGPDRVAAATAVSASLPRAELRAAADFAADLGVRHLTPATNEMGRDGYRANGPDRCYFCKAELTETLRPLAASLGLAHVVTGTNADDAVAGFRPGIGAAAARGARTPLLDVGLSKAQIRAASRLWGLPTWDKPAAACLASRIAYGVTVSPGRLARVELAEAALRAALDTAGLGVRNLRVRDLGEVAMVEVDATHVRALAARPELLTVIEGFERVEIDPRGFRSGSMNELLPRP